MPSCTACSSLDAPVTKTGTAARDCLSLMRYSFVFLPRIYKLVVNHSFLTAFLLSLSLDPALTTVVRCARPHQALNRGTRVAQQVLARNPAKAEGASKGIRLCVFSLVEVETLSIKEPLGTLGAQPASPGSKLWDTCGVIPSHIQ